MNEISTQVQLPFTESDIIFNPHVTDDDNKNNIRDVDEEASATGQRALQDFSVLGQHRMGIQQLHVSASGELFGLSYYIEAGTNNWVINDVKNYRTYLDPSQIGVAFNQVELEDFAQSILAQFETNMQSLSNPEFDEAMARLHYDYLYASASLLVSDDDLATRIAANLDQYTPWYSGEEFVADVPESANEPELPPIPIEVKHEPATEIAEEPEPVVQQLPQPEPAVPVVIPPSSPRLETPLSKTTAHMREALLDFDGLTLQELGVIQQTVRSSKKRQFLADLATRLEDDFISDDDRAYFEEKYGGILRADDGLRWLLDSQFQYAWTNWVMATFSDPANRLELTPEQHEYMLERFLITVHPPVAQLDERTFVFLSEAVLSENPTHREAAYQLLISFGERAKPLAADAVLAHVLYSSETDFQKVLDAMGVDDQEFVGLLVQIVEVEPFKNYEQKTLRNLLEENDRTLAVRAAINTLAEIGPPAHQAAEALIHAKFSADQESNEVIDRALATIGIDPSSQTQILISYLESEDDVIRTKAARFLGQLGSEAKAAVSALMARWKKEDSQTVKAEIDSALNRINPGSSPPPRLDTNRGGPSDQEIANTSGVLGALRDNSELEDLLKATGVPVTASNMETSTGRKVGTQEGSGGLGARGSGLGGGGTADGLGGLSTKGRGSGSSTYGMTDPELVACPTCAIAHVDGGRPVINGSLSYSDVAHVLSSNSALKKILVCYTVSLREVGNQIMSDTVTIKFTIDANGRVTDVKVSFSRTDMSEEKIKSTTENFRKAFRSFTFPKPSDGASVTVSCPFMFTFSPK